MENDWKTIKDCPQYEINRLGVVRDRETHKVKRGGRNRKGCIQFTFPKGVTKYAHRLVAEAFVPNPENHRFVVFKSDSVRPHADNVAWTPFRPRPNQLRKLNEEDFEKIHEMLRIGVKQYEIAEHFLVSPGYISNIKNGRRKCL